MFNGQRTRTAHPAPAGVQRGKRVTLQEQYDASRGHLTLRPGEYRGPLVIWQPGSVIDGAGATIWAEHGPVIRVRARDVTLKDLRAEIIEESSDQTEHTAIHTLAPDTVLEEVEVYGDITGPVEGAGRCSVPRTADFGSFASDERNTFIIHVDVPSRTRVCSTVDGLSVSPQVVAPGPADIVVTVPPMRDGTSLYGEIMLIGAVRRRVYVRGRAQEGARRINADTELTRLPAQRHTDPGPRPSVPEPLRSHGIEAAHHAAPGGAGGSAISVLQRGQRVSLKNIVQDTIRIQLDQEVPCGADPFVFALDANGRVGSDSGFVFQGNTRLDDTGAAVIGTDGAGPYAEFHLAGAPPSVERFVAAFSACADAPPAGGAFRNAVFRVLVDGAPAYTFCPKHDPETRTIVAAEVYRYKGEWKLACVDRGLPTGIAGLYRMYGVETT